MAYKTISKLEGALFNGEPMKLRGGTLYSFTSVAHPHGIHYIQCEKHPHNRMEVAFSITAEHENFFDLAQQALESCADCAHERDHIASRWPNAGEPGGAEL